MAALLGLASIFGLAAAAPQLSTSLAPTTSMTFAPLPSSVSNPVNLSDLYVDSIQVSKPIIVQPQGLNASAYPGYDTTVWNSTDASNSSTISTSQAFNAPEIVVDASCSGPTASSPSTFWREAITHNGIAAMVSNPSSYKVFRNVVTDYGADNTGASDASAALNNAISASSRAGSGTTRPAYVYVPGGTYLISNSVQMLINTFLVGDPLNPPVFKAASTLGTNPIIQGYDGSTGSSTTNFYTVIRNLKLDTTSINNNTVAVALNWAVSQACQLYNLEFNMLDYSNHIGITMNSASGGGSGTIINDCTFNGGGIGIQMSNQQYELKGLTFNGCNTCIYVSHLFVGTFQDISFENCAYGIDMSAANNVGGISLVDSSITSCYAGVRAWVSGTGEGSLIVDNFSVASGTIGIVDSNGNTLLSGGVAAGSTWVMGNENPQNYQKGTTYAITRPPALVANGKYLTQAMPQYENYDVSQFINVKSVAGYTVYGDNTNDDTAALNAIIAAYAGCKIIFFPQGIYKVTGTIYIPTGSILVGEAYSVISGIGSAFYNSAAPVPIVQIGKPGEVGTTQITDMLFSVADVLQGATILEINMKAASQGSVALWNTHLRVGGTADTIVNTNCAGTDTADCKAAFAMLHITSTGGAYIENMWGWTADHSLDGGPNQNIATGRGALIESTSATWLVGTAFEHNTLYQYSINNAANVYIGMQQVETPYWQGTGSAENAPGPWTPLTAYGDPSFSNCATQSASSNQQCYMAWGTHIQSSSSIVIHGSALWVFFNDMVDGSYSNAGCGGICQFNMVWVKNTTQLFWYDLQTKSTTNMVYDGSTVTAATVNNPGGWLGSTPGVVAAYLRDSGITSEQ